MFEAEPFGHRDRELVGRQRAALEQHLADQLARLGGDGDRVLDRVAIAEPEADDDVAQPLTRLLDRLGTRHDGVDRGKPVIRSESVATILVIGRDRPETQRLRRAGDFVHVRGVGLAPAAAYAGGTSSMDTPETRPAVVGGARLRGASCGFRARSDEGAGT